MITLRRALIVSLIYQAILAAILFLLIIAPHPTLLEGRFNAILSNWDARAYLHIASHGYQVSGDTSNYIVFFPLYPLLIRVLSYLLDPVVAGILITTLSSVLGHALFILYLQDLGLSEKRVWRSTAIFFAYPAAFFFSAVYTEALFLLLSVSLLLLLRHERFGWAGLIGFLAALTRPVGLLLCVPFIFSLLKSRTPNSRISSALAVLLIPLGLVVYFGINHAIHGDPFYYQLPLKNNWHKSFADPLVRYSSELTASGWDFTNIAIADRITTLITPVLILLYLAISRNDSVRLPGMLIVWAVAQWLLVATQSFWLSNTRYLMLALPLFPMLERVTTTLPGLYWATLSLLICSAGYACFLFSLGWWTF